MDKDNKVYFTLTGHVGKYNNYNNALRATKDGNPEDVLVLGKKYFDRNLIDELYILVESRGDLDFSVYSKYLDTDIIESLVKNQKYGNYVRVYITREFSNYGVKYMILIVEKGKRYYYKTKTEDMVYGTNVDLVPLTFVLNLEKRYGLTGEIVSFIPFSRDEKSRLPRWNFREISPLDYDIDHSIAISLMKGEVIPFDVEEIRGGI